MVTDVIDINFTFLKIVFGYILLIFSNVLRLLIKKKTSLKVKIYIFNVKSLT